MRLWFILPFEDSKGKINHSQYLHFKTPPISLKRARGFKMETGPCCKQAFSFRIKKACFFNTDVFLASVFSNLFENTDASLFKDLNREALENKQKRRIQLPPSPPTRFRPISGTGSGRGGVRKKHDQNRFRPPPFRFKRANKEFWAKISQCSFRYKYRLMNQTEISLNFKDL